MATNSKLTLLSKEKKAANLKVMSDDSIKWLKERIDEIKRADKIARNISKETDRFKLRPMIGMLYCFYYDAKWKAELPYWDAFPVVIVLERYDDGFLGLNLHYLPLKYRIAFMKKLMQFATLTKSDEISRMRITYDIVASTKKFAEFKPCVKRYLNSQLRSRLLKVHPHEWDTAMMLPLQQFRKAKAETIWKDSVKEYKDQLKQF